MYGLVNRAVQGLVETAWGDAAWAAICADAGVDPAGFLAMESYPDEITYRLVAAASKHSGWSAEEILRAFGEYWVLYTGREGYGALMTATGSNLEEFLTNLDNLHSRVSTTFTELSPPSFRTEVVASDTLRLHYYSHRPGLTPLVVGLLEGLGQMFETRVAVTVERSRADGAAHDTFLVRHGRDLRREVDA